MVEGATLEPFETVAYKPELAKHFESMLNNV